MMLGPWEVSNCRGCGASIKVTLQPSHHLHTLKKPRKVKLANVVIIPVLRTSTQISIVLPMSLVGVGWIKQMKFKLFCYFL